MNRIMVLLAGVIVCVSFSPAKGAEEPEGTLRTTSSFLDVTLSLQQPAIASLSVDSLGRGRFRPGSLRQAPVASAVFDSTRVNGNGLNVEYRRRAAASAPAPGWRIQVAEREVRLISRWSELERPEPVVLEFDPHRCHATLLGIVDEDSCVRLPALLHLPDQGSCRITSNGTGRPVLGYDARHQRGRIRAAVRISRRRHPPSRGSSIGGKSWRSIQRSPESRVIPVSTDFAAIGSTSFQINPRLRAVAGWPTRLPPAIPVRSVCTNTPTSRGTRRRSPRISRPWTSSANRSIAIWQD